MSTSNAGIVRCERYRASAFAYSEVLRIARTVTFGVKDFPVIARHWAAAGQAHASSAIVVGINHDKFGAILDTITRELAARRDRAIGSSQAVPCQDSAGVDVVAGSSRLGGKGFCR